MTPELAPRATLRKDSAIALYHQVADTLTQEITSGVFGASGRIPAETELGLRFGVSRVTVRLALERLEKAGLIERRQGKGTFAMQRTVRQRLDTIRSFHDVLVQQGLDARMRLLDLTAVSMPPSLLPSFPSGGGVLLRRLHLISDRPIALATSYLPPFMAGVAREEAERRPTYALLAQLAGQPICTADVSIGAGAADGEEARLLRLTEGGPVLILERLSHFADGTVAEQSIFRIRPDSYRFTLHASV